MKIFNITSLIRLFKQSQAEKLFNGKKGPIKNKDLNSAVTAIFKKQYDEELQEAAVMVTQLYKDSQEAIAEEKAIIADAQEAIKLANERIHDLEHATAYGEETSNYLPLVCLLEENLVIVTSSSNGLNVTREDFCVPADFNIKK